MTAALAPKNADAKPAGWTAFPNDLLDSWMPQLRDTEWRILCIIVRQTIGRTERTSGARKSVDWLTHSQLKTRSGRASSAVSAAVDRLIRIGLIKVTNDAGKELISSRQRRRSRGRLYFRLASYADNKPSHKVPAFEPSISENDAYISQTENRKPKTTKEPININIPIGSEQRINGNANSDIDRFLAMYLALYRARSPRMETPPIAWAKERRRATALTNTYSTERLDELLRQFFKSQALWIRKGGYSLGTFYAAIPSLLMDEADHTPRVRTNGLTRVDRLLP